MAGNATESERLGRHLADFARSQAVIVSPTSARDVERASTIGDMNKDGRMDLLNPDGWWEQPSNKQQTPWKFHPAGFGQGQGMRAPAAPAAPSSIDR